MLYSKSCIPRCDLQIGDTKLKELQIVGSNEEVLMIMETEKILVFRITKIQLQFLGYRNRACRIFHRHDKLKVKETNACSE